MPTGHHSTFNSRGTNVTRVWPEGCVVLDVIRKPRKPSLKYWVVKCCQIIDLQISFLYQKVQMLQPWQVTVIRASSYLQSHLIKFVPCRRSFPTNHQPWQAVFLFSIQMHRLQTVDGWNHRPTCRVPEQWKTEQCQPQTCLGTSPRGPARDVVAS